MKKIIIIGLLIFIAACAKTEEDPLQETQELTLQEIEIIKVNYYIEGYLAGWTDADQVYVNELSKSSADLLHKAMNSLKSALFLKTWHPALAPLTYSRSSGPA